MQGWLCAVLGIVAALIAGGLAYIFLRPNNKKLAKKLDKELALHEKVQTMVEFKDAEDIMAALPGISPRMLDRHLQTLRESGRIEYRGSRKTGAYFIL